MNAEDHKIRNSQEAYSRRQTSAAKYGRDNSPTEDTTIEEQSARESDERAAYLARREARRKQILLAESLNKPPRTEKRKKNNAAVSVAVTAGRTGPPSRPANGIAGRIWNTIHRLTSRLK